MFNIDVPLHLPLLTSQLAPVQPALQRHWVGLKQALFTSVTVLVVTQVVPHPVIER